MEGHLKSKGAVQKRARVTGKENPVWCWAGVRIKPEEEEEGDNQAEGEDSVPHVLNVPRFEVTLDF